MTRKMWPLRSSTRLRIDLGYGTGSLIRCINLLIKHCVRFEEIKVDSERSYSALGPTAIEVTIRHPGKKRIKTAIAALNRSSFGCREEMPQRQLSRKD